MKKLLALLNTPARAVIAVGLIVLVSEYLIMALFDVIHGAFPTRDDYQLVMIFNYLDPILLIAIVAPTLYILIFRPMRNQQDELEVAHRKVERAHRKWMAALDVVDDPIFLHDKAFHILRCNKAYQQRAGIPLPEIIGQPYYEIFPKIGAPLPCCLRAMEKEEEELAAGDAIYRSRAFSVHDEQGAYLYSVHILEDITERKQAEDALRVSTLKYQLLFDSSRDALMLLAPPSWKFIGANQTTLKLFGASSVAEFTALGPWGVSPERQPDGRPSSEKAQEMIAIAMREGSHFFEWEHQRLGGQPFAADVLLTRMKAGEDVFLQATVRDITERKRAEAALSEQLKELRGWHDVTLGREMRVLELKHEVDELLAQAGQPPRYPSAESDDQQEK